MLATGAIGIISINYVSQRNDQVYKKNIQPTETIRTVNDLMNQYRLKVYQQVASIEINERLMLELPSLAQEIDVTLSDRDSLFLTRQEQRKFDNLLGYWLHLKKSYVDILELSINYAKEEALEKISGENQLLSSNKTIVLSELISLKLRGIEQANAQNHIVQLWSLFITLATLIAGIFASLFFIMRYNREIQDHITNLEHKVEERTADLNDVCHTLEEKKQQLEKLVILDPLLGIYNRRHFDEVLGREWRNACRDRNTLAIIMIDVDFFKLYNDNYGHTVGDNALRKVATMLKNHLKRPADFICRYGGEEFCIILPNSSIENIKNIANELCQAVEGLKLEHAYSEVSNYVTISLGIVAATLPTSECTTPDAFVQIADEMLYKAKRNGKNQVQQIIL